MKISINNGPQWHEYAPGVRFKIQPLTRADLRNIAKDAAGDEEKSFSLTADMVILDWEGLVGEDQQPLEVTLENKLAVMGNVPLALFIDGKSSGLVVIEEEEEKN